MSSQVKELPVFHLLAGPNGAGKSTLYRALVRDGLIAKDMPFVNADLYERDHLQLMADPESRSQAARTWAEAERTRLLIAGDSFVSETVFSHVSKLTLIEDATAHGYMVALHVVALDDPQRLLGRVKARVREGGHDVPADRILARYPRTLHNLTKAVRRASVAYLYEARETSDGGPQLVAICEGHQTTRVVDAVPRWAEQVLAG